MKGEKMYKLKKNVTIIITVIMVLLFGTMTINLANTVNSTNQYTNNTISEESRKCSNKINWNKRRTIKKFR